MGNRKGGLSLLTVVLAALGFIVAAWATPPPGGLPGQDPCGHGATGKPCKPDPQPEHGKDCLHHGKNGGVNEDHCLGATTPTTTTGTTTVGTTAGTTTGTTTATTTTVGTTTGTTTTVGTTTAPPPPPPPPTTTTVDTTVGTTTAPPPMGTATDVSTTTPGEIGSAPPPPPSSAAGPGTPVNGDLPMSGLALGSLVLAAMLAVGAGIGLLYAAWRWARG